MKVVSFFFFFFGSSLTFFVVFLYQAFGGCGDDLVCSRGGGGGVNCIYFILFLERKIRKFVSCVCGPAHLRFSRRSLYCRCLRRSKAILFEI